MYIIEESINAWQLDNWWKLAFYLTQVELLYHGYAD